MEITFVLSYMDAKIKHIAMLEPHNGTNLLRRYLWLIERNSYSSEFKLKLVFAVAIAL